MYEYKYNVYGVTVPIKKESKIGKGIESGMFINPGQHLGSGIKRAGDGIKRAGDGIKRAGDGIKRAGDGLVRAGNGKTKRSLDDYGVDDIEGGCMDCMEGYGIKDNLEMFIEKTPKIGEELKRAMLLKYCK